MSEFFTFDPTLSPDQNLDRFFAHLETVNKEFAQLLRAKLLPLPDGQQPRQI